VTFAEERRSAAVKQASMILRRDFIGALAAAGLLPAATGIAGTASGSRAPEPLERTLVLSGGGARGAYEAGVVCALAAAAGVPDGQPLPRYAAVCGTSIGALNGWAIATGQYRKLRELWYGISGENILRLKPEYAALEDPESGVLNRFASAIGLLALTKNEPAVLQSKPIFDWLARNVDPEIPVLVPLAWAVTNLTTQRPEYFYLMPLASPQVMHERVETAMMLTLGPHTVVRRATPELLQRALFASAAIPLAFDPVALPSVDGSINQYVDGGVASNSPVAIAHAVSKAADVVLLDPPFESEGSLDDAIGVAMGAFGTMQRKILEVEMRNVYFQSRAKRAFERIGPNALGEDADLLRRFLESVPATDLAYIRPKAVLPLGVGSFDDEVGIGKAFRIGWEDAAGGFTAYTWETFEL